MSRGRRRGAGRSEPADAGLPLEALEAALAPVRRALVVGHTADVHLRPIVERHLAVASALELPEALGASLQRMAEHAARLPDAGRDDLAAELHRLDAVAGLPLTRDLRPVRKRPLMPSEPRPPRREPEPAEADDTRSDDESDDDDDDEALRWSGRLERPVVQIMPDLAGRLPDDLTVGQVLFTPPRAVKVVAPVQGAGRQLPEGRVAVGGRVRSRATLCRADGGREAMVRLVGAGPLMLRWRDQPVPHESLLPPGERVVVVGQHVDGELLDAEVVVPDGGRSVALPTYDDPDDGRARREALLRLRPQLEQLRDPLHPRALRPLALRSRAEVAVALQEGRGRDARRRLAFDEALRHALATGAARYAPQADRGVPHPVVHGFAARCEQQLELSLDDPAQAVLEELKRSLRQSTPTRRLLTGEVGAGKGRIALLAAAMVAEGKGQVLVVGPDDAEVDERFGHSEPLLREGGLVARRLSGQPPKSALDAVKRGEIHVVFGTHELLRAELPFRRLGLVVSVERFPFGASRAAYEALGAPRPDLVVLSQVPVGSRVLATAYADFDVSVVVDPERSPATIEVTRAQERDAAYASLSGAVARGEQGMLLFPRVKGADALDLRQGHAVVQALQADALSEARVALLHGAMRHEERRRVFTDFLHRRLDVVVATVPLEDGPPIPGLTTVVVEQADRMAQWRLHRVIGFLSTTPRPSRALLIVGEHADADAEARIQRVLGAADGFELTEARVALRGLEACVVDPPWPLPTFQWLDLDEDRDLLLAAREEAHRILRADPSLRRGSHAQLAAEVRSTWAAMWGDEAPPCPLPEGPPPERKRRRRRRRRR
jgi:ATP-dependent DNA helicase RecG